MRARREVQHLHSSIEEVLWQTREISREARGNQAASKAREILSSKGETRIKARIKTRTRRNAGAVGRAAHRKVVVSLTAVRTRGLVGAPSGSHLEGSGVERSRKDVRCPRLLPSQRGG